MNRLYYQPDGVDIQTARILMDAFKIQFPCRKADISCMGILILFLCGHLKTKVHRNNPRDIHEVKVIIRNEINKKCSDILKKGTASKMQESFAVNGGNL